MGIPFALLCLSTFLTCTLLILLLRIKNKKLHHSALGLILVVLLWCIVTLGELYTTSIHQNNGMLFTNLLIFYNRILPVSLFIFGFNYIGIKMAEQNLLAASGSCYRRGFDLDERLSSPLLYSVYVY